MKRERIYLVGLCTLLFQVGCGENAAQNPSPTFQRRVPVQVRSVEFPIFARFRIRPKLDRFINSPDKLYIRTVLVQPGDYLTAGDAILKFQWEDAFQRLKQQQLFLAERQVALGKQNKEILRLRKFLLTLYDAGMQKTDKYKQVLMRHEKDARRLSLLIADANKKIRIYSQRMRFQFLTVPVPGYVVETLVSRNVAVDSGQVLCHIFSAHRINFEVTVPTANLPGDIPRDHLSYEIAGVYTRLRGDSLTLVEKPGRIEISGVSTFIDTDVYFSVRDVPGKIFLHRTLFVLPRSGLDINPRTRVATVRVWRQGNPITIPVRVIQDRGGMVVVRGKLFYEDEVFVRAQD